MITSCHCQKPPFSYIDYTTIDLGEDQHGAEISLSTCKRCQTVWLKYLIEEPQFSRSGRWWRVVVLPEQIDTLNLNNARGFIEQQDESFVGGSYFESLGMKIKAPIRIS